MIVVTKLEIRIECARLAKLIVPGTVTAQDIIAIAQTLFDFIVSEHPSPP
jgi:hypothetical protein